MESNLNMVIDQVSKDKGIERKVLTLALEEAILASAKKAFGIERALTAEYNEEKGAVDLSQTITVVANVEDTFNQISVDECEELGRAALPQEGWQDPSGVTVNSKIARASRPSPRSR